MSARTPRYICIHGHFYQPPRENPWLEAIEIQDSAAPYHDWNERITRECYAPNSRSRLLDGQGKIIGLINNYAWMSFNFGPTLLSWMEGAAPEVLHGIVEGDRLSHERRRGHGNALAQVYNHAIMPLASPRDKRTQVLWGLTDFRRRFGREPEGMWLAETAVDLATLEALADAGIRFTVLAPRQARRWREIGKTDWTEVPEGVDPSRAYLCRLRSGRTIALFFYDGFISRQVAFERLLDSGEKFLGRLRQGFDDHRRHAQLVHMATDGESYGHHHPHGDMALAYVLSQLGKDPDIRLTNYGEYLELHPPQWEVEIHENSSWSCAHGIERWRSNCGCNMGRGWHQLWRGPLRQAMDRLKDRLDSLFETRGKECFIDPWPARDASIDVILDRSEASVHQFLQRFGLPHLSRHGQQNALRLVEMQRHALLMYTSCGWFFDEISGLETTQCLQYAARAIQLARHFEGDFEADFVRDLEQAPSNDPAYRHGRGVWERKVEPAQIDLERVLAHHAMSTIDRPVQPHTSVYCFDMESLDQKVRSRGNTHLAMGRLRVRSRLTWDEAETNFIVIHFGGLDFHTVLRPAMTAHDYEAFKHRVFKTYAAGSLADVTAQVLKDFGGEVHRFDDLFTEERRRIIDIALHDRFDDYQRILERLADQDEEILNTLGRLEHPIPKPLRFAASTSLDSRLVKEIERLSHDGSVSRIQELLERGRAWGYQPDEPQVLARLLTQQLQEVLQAIHPDADLPALNARAGQLLNVALFLGIPLDIWQAQNQLLNAYADLVRSGSLNPLLRDGFAVLAARLNVNEDLLGWQP